MKKILLLILTLILCISFSACAESELTAEKAVDEAENILKDAYFPWDGDLKSIDGVPVFWLEIGLLDFSDESDEIVLEAAEMASIRDEYGPKLKTVLSKADIQLALVFERYDGSPYGMVVNGKFISAEEIMKK